jgi:hypothetical protein
MFSLVSFSAIWRHRRQGRKSGASLLAHGDVDAGEFSEEYFPQADLPEDYDPATTHDLSYDDALLDARVRHFMSEEYGRVEPSQGVFQRLVKLLNSEQVQSAGPGAPLLTRWFAGAYEVVSGQALSRLVPSGIAVAILVVVGLGSNAPGLLPSTQLLVGAESTPVKAQDVDTLYVNAPVQDTQTFVQESGQSTLDVTGGEEAYIVLRGSMSLNLPYQNREPKEIEAPTYNRLGLDPF